MLFACLTASACDDEGAASGPEVTPPAPVSVAPVEERAITLRRTFSGALEATAEVMVAPRVSGQLERLSVNIGDVIERGQVVAMIDDAELQQALAQSEADLSVARANQAEAEAAHEIADRAFRRAETLHGQGVASESELDAARTAALARSSRIAVTAAQVARAEAALEAARIRLGEAQVVASWETGRSDDAPSVPGSTRLVAARFVDEGSIVASGSPIISIVELQPILAVVFVPERDYSFLAIGQEAALETDAYPNEVFTGRVARIAPVFSRNSRQVRVELEIENPELRLKPGMFVRATLELGRADDATVVPYDALTQRGEQKGVFTLSTDGITVRWRPVETGIREGRWQQVLGEGVTGQVVTLGQEMCDDGAAVTVIEHKGKGR